MDVEEFAGDIGSATFEAHVQNGSTNEERS